MLFLDGVYLDSSNGSVARFRWVKAPTSQELTQLAHRIAHRVGRFLERQGLLEQNAENSYLALDAVDEGAMDQLLGSCTIASEQLICCIMAPLQYHQTGTGAYCPG